MMSTKVSAPMVGKLVSIDVKVGDAVKKDAPIASLEAMKMIVKVFAPADGVVKEITASPGDVVNPDIAIMTLE